jgi:hypothetical protein
MKFMLSKIKKTLSLLTLALLQLTAEAEYRDGVKALNAGDYVTAFKEFQTLAEAGDAEAQFELGFMYSDGKGVEKNVGESMFWVCQAAGQQHSRAQKVLALFNKNPSGIALQKNAKTPVYKLRSDTTPAFLLEKNASIWVMSDLELKGANGRTSIIFSFGELHQCGFVDIQNIYLENKKNVYLADTAFQKTIRVGAETNCGPALEIRGELVKIYSPVKDYGNEHWIRRDQLYPPRSGCSFQNGRYIGR